MTIDPIPEVNPLLDSLARLGVQHAIGGLSQMVGEELNYTEPMLYSVPVMKVPEFSGGPENEAVGVYLRASGEASGQFLLILPIVKALEFNDMLMSEPPGTTQELDDMGKSALAEMGNLAGAFFLNSIAQITGLETLPSEPAVMFDMVAAILDVIVATSAEKVDEVVIIKTNIIHGEREVQTDFWYIPDAKAMEALDKKAR
jgi:chemotaxis protein CheC